MIEHAHTNGNGEAAINPLGTPGTVSTVTISAGVPTGGSGTVSTLDNIFDATGGPASIKGASSGAAVATDKALVVTLRDVNANGPPAGLPSAGPAGSAPVVPADQYAQYEVVAAGVTTAQTLGLTGATGDYLAGVLVFPSLASCSAVAIIDNATTIGTFPGGGTTALTDLKPFLIPVGLYSVSGPWKITTGASGVSVVGIGKFT